jgi:hypothetical protein
MATQPEPADPTTLPIDVPVPEPVDPPVVTPADPGAVPSEPPAPGSDPWTEGP